jgi:hypothetical protein
MFQYACENRMDVVSFPNLTNSCCVGTTIRSGMLQYGLPCLTGNIQRTRLWSARRKWSALRWRIRLASAGIVPLM